MTTYIHERDGWPKFRWSEGKIALQLADVRHRQGRLIGRMERLGFQLNAEAVLQTLTVEVVKSSEIEGEVLDKEQVRSSIARRLGMDIGALAPADRRLYAIRDVTATVESIALITASILSKKLAAGLQALVMDVKTGSGAFMKTEADAVGLAELLAETGQRMGKRVVALVTDMDQPLGGTAGNALEVIEAVEILRGEGPEDLRQLCLELAGWMLYLGGVADTVAEAKKQSEKLISSGKALDKFRQMVELQGGDPRVIDDPKKLPQAQHAMTLSSPNDGYLASLQCEQVGTACVILGGGRERKEDSVDPAVGIVLHRKVGDAVSAGEPLATIYYNAAERATRARQLLEESYRIADSPVHEKRPLIHRVIGKSGEKN